MAVYSEASHMGVKSGVRLSGMWLIVHNAARFGQVWGKDGLSHCVNG